MTLTSSDIGTNPSVVELNLTRHFKTAKSWGAILLIDEADVFMERRSTNDLTRNSLVAGQCPHEPRALHTLQDISGAGGNSIPVYAHRLGRAKRTLTRLF